MSEALPSFLGSQLGQLSSQTGVPEKIEKAKSEKERGNQLFGKGETRQALAAYHSCKLCVKGLMNISTEHSEAIKTIEQSCNLNMSAAYIKLGEWNKAIAAASLVLEQDPDNVKALFRRGKAYLEQGQCDKSRIDLIKAIKLSPNDSTLREEYARLQNKEAQQAQQAKSVFKNIFSSSN